MQSRHYQHSLHEALLFTSGYIATDNCQLLGCYLAVQYAQCEDSPCVRTSPDKAAYMPADLAGGAPRIDLTDCHKLPNCHTLLLANGGRLAYLALLAFFRLDAQSRP